jgi:hypothetical protein
MSRAKAVYLRDLAARLEDGRLDLDRLCTLDDDAVRTTGSGLDERPGSSLADGGDIGDRRMAGDARCVACVAREC